MATRTQIVQRALARIHSGNLDPVPWYTKEDAWVIMLQVAGFSADVFRAFNKPVVAGSIDTVSNLVQRQVLTKQDATTWLRGKLQAISLQIQDINKDQDPILYARLDAQLELIMELLSEDKVNDG